MMRAALKWNLRKCAALAVLPAMLFGACAPAPAPEKKEVKQIVFPSPPDEPRFYLERSIRGSADVNPSDAETSMRFYLTGEMTGSEPLGKPYAVAVRQGKVYVSDTVDRYVKVFDFPAKKFYKVGDDDQEPLIKPLGIDVDKSGNLYVADATKKAILVYGPSGNFLRKIGSEKFFDRLSSVTVDETGTRLYVVDIGGVSSEHHQVRVFNAQTGEHLFDFGKRGTALGEFNLPRDLAVGKDGRLYVVDGGNFRVEIFDRDGKPIKAFGQIGRQPGMFARPKEIATDSGGNVYVADSAFGNFQIFDPEGQLLMFVGNRGERDGPATYMLPSGIAVDEDGRVYFVDQFFRKVDVYRPAAIKENEGYLGRALFTKEPKQADKK
jgi:DNA-binding beta-propeller fold protein YncE